MLHSLWFSNDGSAIRARALCARTGFKQQGQDRTHSSSDQSRSMPALAAVMASSPRVAQPVRAYISEVLVVGFQEYSVAGFITGDNAYAGRVVIPWVGRLHDRHMGNPRCGNCERMDCRINSAVDCPRAATWIRGGDDCVGLSSPARHSYSARYCSSHELERS